MWTPEDLQLQKTRVNFSASGQPEAEITQLWSDAIELINAIEYVNWSDSVLQFMICQQCGYVGCKSKDWVELRRTGSIALIMPTFSKLEESTQSTRDEFLPPRYLLERGIIFADWDRYESELCPLAPFPDFETLSPLLAWEAAKIFQLEAPHAVLGSIVNPPELYPDVVIASSDGNFIDQTN